MTAKLKSNYKIAYKVFESNSGTLTLFVKNRETNKWTYCHSGYEFNRGQLAEDIYLLNKDEDPIENNWDGNFDDFGPYVKDIEQALKECEEYDIEVANNFYEDGKTTPINTKRWGVNARIELDEILR